MYTIFFKTLAIFAVMGFGFILRRRNVIDAAFNRQMSLVLVNVFYPALILSSIVRNFTFASLVANWALPAGSAMIMLIGWGVGVIGQRLMRRQAPATAGVFLFQCTMNNYSFLPIMLAAGLLGNDAVSLVIFSTIGAEICVWTLGLQAMTGQRPSLAALRHLASVPMMAMLAGCLVLLAKLALGGAADRWAGDPWAGPPLAMALDALALAGQATIPVSAIIVGSRMGSLHPHHLLSWLMAVTTVLRLLVIPAIATALLVLLPFPPATRPVLLIVAAQPAAMVSVTLAEVYGSDAEYAAASVLLTHVFCLLTIPLWLSAPWF